MIRNNTFLKFRHFLQIAFVTICLSVFFINSTLAQAGFQKFYEFGNKEAAYGMTSDGSGNMILTGITQRTGLLVTDITLTSISPAGTVNWSKYYASVINDIGRDVIKLSGGGYCIAGRTNGSGSGGFNGLLIKTDDAGNLVWSNGYGGVSADEFFAVAETPEGGFVAAGFTWTSGATSSDLYMVKTDSDGNMLWNRTYGSAGGHEEAHSIIIDSAGNYVLVGFTDSLGTSRDIYVLQTDSAGNKLWSKTVAGGDVDVANKIIEITGGYALTGYTKSYNGAQNSNVFVMRMLRTGTTNGWGVFHNANFHDEGMSLAQTADNGFIIAGGTQSTETAFLMKVDNTLNLEWYNQYEGDRHYAVAVNGSGYLAVGDFTYSSGTEDMLFVNTDAGGITSTSCTETSQTPTSQTAIFNQAQPSDQFSAAGNKIPTAMTSGNVVFTKGDACDPIAVDPEFDPGTITVSPNPATDHVRIDFDLDQSFSVKVKLMDMTGRIIQEKMLGTVMKSREAFELTELNAGIYHLIIEGENWRRAEKVLIMK